MSIYCTYLTLYKGNKLPPFYIGSTSETKIQKGYRGSIKSKRYKKIWDSEIKTNPNLFKTKVLSTHLTRDEALQQELKLQKFHKIPYNPLFINQSLASPNGFFGNIMSGKNSPRFGFKASKETKAKLSKSHKGKQRSKTHKENISKALSKRKGEKRPSSFKDFRRQDNLNREWYHNPITKKRIHPKLGSKIPEGFIKGKGTYN